MTTKTSTKTSARPSPSRQAVKARPARSPSPTKATRKQPSTPPAVLLPPVSKQQQLISLLRSPEGATIESMTSLTGWQPHTVRGTISGVLRKKLSLNVVCQATGDGQRVYRIVAPAA